MTTKAADAKRSDVSVLSMLSKVPPGVEPPAPMLYDRAVHQAHRQGKYRSLKPVEKRKPIVLLPKSSLWRLVVREKEQIDGNRRQMGRCYQVFKGPWIQSNRRVQPSWTTLKSERRTSTKKNMVGLAAMVWSSCSPSRGGLHIDSLQH